MQCNWKNVHWCSWWLSKIFKFIKRDLNMLWPLWNSYPVINQVDFHFLAKFMKSVKILPICEPILSFCCSTAKSDEKKYRFVRRILAAFRFLLQNKWLFCRCDILLVKVTFDTFLNNFCFCLWNAIQQSSWRIKLVSYQKYVYQKINGKFVQQIP